MPRALSLKETAARLARWAQYGFDVGLIDAGMEALQPDLRESKGRAPRKSGRLEATIRIVKPSARAAAKRGYVKLGLTAGSRSKDRGKAVPYARVHQEGEVWGGGNSRKHPIRARVGLYGPDGKFRTTGKLALPPYFPREVTHPGTDWRKKEYLQIQEPRAAATVERSQARGLLRALGDA